MEENNTPMDDQATPVADDQATPVVPADAEMDAEVAAEDGETEAPVAEGVKEVSEEASNDEAAA